jgi:hypothetical protein
MRSPVGENRGRRLIDLPGGVICVAAPPLTARTNRCDSCSETPCSYTIQRPSGDAATVLILAESSLSSRVTAVAGD